MGLIKGVLKLVLSILFVIALVGFVIMTSVHGSFQEDTFKTEFKDTIKQDSQIISEIDNAYQEVNEHFFIFNNTEDFIPTEKTFNFTITKEDANLSNADFQEFVLDKIADSIYDAEQETPLGTLSINVFAEKMGSYSEIFLILSVLLGLALFALFSGRFILLGINLLVASISYYPTKFMFLTTGNKIGSNLPEIFRNFINNLMTNSYNISARFFLGFLIAGIILVAVGILIKFLKIGLWFQGFFESKKKK